MVEHPSEYPWSSYHKNALGTPIKLITPHYCYDSLGKTEKLRQENYKSLFDDQIPDYTMKEITDAVNKAWVLGNDRFLKQIEIQKGQRVKPNKRGGDRKSKEYKSKC